MYGWMDVSFRFNSKHFSIHLFLVISCNERSGTKDQNLFPQQKILSESQKKGVSGASMMMC
jgi:hypothetical protein